MLTSSTMGLVALAALWVNMCLVAADAWRRRARLSALLGELRASRRVGAVVRASITEGDGADGAFAVSEIDQLGRAMTVSGPRRILFTDRARRAEVRGGRVRLGDSGLAVVPAPSAEVWCCADERPRGDAAAFDRAWEPASTFKGFPTTLAERVAPGDEVWLWLDGPPGEGRESVRVVAREDPEQTLVQARRPLTGVILLALAGLVCVTTLALWPPPLGLVSMLGAALGVTMFLGLPPLGAAARDRALLPSQRKVGGLWQRP